MTEESMEIVKGEGVSLGFLSLRLSALLLLLTPVGCSDSTAEAPSLSTLRDSAGIVIVENGTPDPESPLPWHLSDTPKVSIGTIDGAPEDQLFRVRTATRLADGRIAVANTGSNEVRIFDGSGAHLKSLGGKGEGPGEFQLLTDVMVWPGDSIGAWDAQLRRLTIYNGSGALGRTFSLEDGEGMAGPSFIGLLPNGNIVGQGRAGFMNNGVPTEGLIRPDLSYGIWDTDGHPISSLGSHPGNERVVFIAGTPGNIESIDILTHPFGHRIQAQVWGDKVLIAPSDTYNLPAFSSEGKLQRIIRRTHELRAGSQDLLGQLTEEMVKDLPTDQRIQRLERYNDLPPVETVPAFRSILVDALDHIWVRDFEVPRGASEVWSVFDAEGRILGPLELPTDLTVYEIGADYVLGLTKDEYDVEHVQLWELRR